MKDKKVVFSPFIGFDMKGEIIFHQDVPCPRCDFWMGGEYAGSFSCEICGFNEYPKYSLEHGQSLLFEGLWKVVRRFLPSKRLRWEVSAILWNFSIIQELRHRKHTTYIQGNHIWREGRWEPLDIP